MKELTIEQKARAYDKSLERAKKLQKTCDRQAVVGWCEYIFPVLKESEDERIRKWIKKELENKYVEDGIVNNVLADKAFAWLEKQGTPKQVSIWKHWKDGIAGNGEGKPIYLVKIGNTYSLNSCLGFECDYIELSELDNLMLEKQGHTDSIIEKAKTEKQRVIITETDGNANIDWDTRSLEDAKRLLECGLQYINTEIEKQSKPKFKIGDWIINHQTGLIKRIKNVLLCGINGIYEFESSSMPIDYVDNTFHLWTIQDAKDGDVLATKDTVFIFKHMDKAGLSLCKSYCEVIGNSKLGFGFDFSINNVHPATKEQRDLLFQKMREAGYTFDFEKNKIIMNVAKAKFKIGDWVVDKNGTVQQILSYKNGIYKHTNGYSSKMFEDEWRLWDITKDAKDGDVLFHSDSASNGIFIFKELLKYEFGEKVVCYCDYDSEDGFCLGEHHTCCWADAKILHPATQRQRTLLFAEMYEAGYKWDTEKRELKEVKNTRPLLSDFFNAEYERGKADTLKSVEWSEEDENNINSIVSRLEVDISYWESRSKTRTNEDEKLINWLKSLRPWNNITNEELAQARREAYNEVLDKIEYNDDWPTFDDGWNAAIRYLKKRNAMPQNQWKPSEEQMDALLFVVQHYTPNVTDKLAWDSLKTLEIMYNDLKKL